MPPGPYDFHESVTLIESQTQSPMQDQLAAPYPANLPPRRDRPHPTARAEIELKFKAPPCFWGE